MDQIPLSPSEVQTCEQEVAELHPFRSTHICQMFACLEPIFKKYFKKKQDSEHKKLKKEAIKQGGDTSYLQMKYKKTFASMGFGINYYFHIVGVLVLFFLGAAILSCWMFYSYSLRDNSSNDHFIFKYSLGNMGYSKPKCLIMKSEWSSVNLTCDSGVLNKLELFGYPLEGNAYFSICEISHSKRIEGANLSKLMDFTICENKPYCVLKLNRSHIHNHITVDENQPLFLKYSCGQTDSREAQKISHLWITFIITAIISIAFIIIIFILIKSERAAFNKWDVCVTTAADYTVCCHISKDHYLNFVQSNSEIIENSIEYFIQFLQNGIQEELNKRFDHKNSCKIAEINLSFSNERVIFGLMQRGNESIVGNREKRLLVEMELNEIISKDSHKLKIPTEAFITFEEEDWYYNCMKVKELNVGRSFELKFEEVPEPTDIAWEYWGASTPSRIKSVVVTSLVSLFIVAITIFVLFMFNYVTSSYKIDEIFSLRFGLSIEPEHINNYIDLAMDDYIKLQQGKTPTGILQHFCQDYSSRYGTAVTKKTVFTRTSKNLTDTTQAPICQDMSWEEMKNLALSYGIGYSMSGLIVISNIISNMIIRSVSNWSAFKTITGRNQIVLLAQFLLSFFLTGVAMHSIYSLRQDEYFSFPREWYNEVGCIIVTTVTVQIITGPFSWFMDWIIYNIKIMWDRRSFSYSPVTQQVTQQGYISLYSGPPFQLERHCVTWKVSSKANGLQQWTWPPFVTHVANSFYFELLYISSYDRYGEFDI